MARIGDQDLARQSSPVKKSFYTEVPEIAAMPLTEVQAWQAERAISVEGSSIRPLLTFAQSGKNLQNRSAHATS